MIIITAAIIFGVTFAYGIWIELKKWHLNRTKLKAFGKLKEYPFVGVGGRFFGQDNEEAMSTMNRLFYEGPTPFAAWLGPTLMIGIDDPADMQLILNSDQCLDKPYMYRHLRNRTGLLASRKDVWKQHRRQLNPTFNSKVMQNFIPIMNDKAKTLCNQMDENVGKTFDIYRPVFKALTDAIINTALGTKWEMQTAHGDKLHDIFIEVMNSFQRRVVRFWLQWDFFYLFTKEGKRETALLEEGYRFLRSVRETKEIEICDKLRNNDDILAKAKADNALTWIQKCFLLYREGSFTNEHLIEEIDTIFVGGTDTTTVTISSTLIMLAIYPELQDKVVAELREIFDSPDQPVSYEDLTKMTYLEMVIKETLRHFPVGPFIARECTEDFPLRGGIIPKDTIVALNIDKMHKDPKYWGDKANAFYPEHFLPENYEKMHPYTFLAFSGGPRNCVGIKYAWFVAKIMLSSLLRQYRFKTHLKFEDIRTKVSIILKIANENPIQVERREW